MKSTSTTRACVAAVAATTLLGSAVAVTLVGTASASTEQVTAPLAAPAGLAPDDEGKPLPHVVRKSVTLSWSPVSGATGYRVQVGTDSTWSADGELSFNADVSSTQVTLPVSLPHATYVWRVAALKGSAVGHWSSEEGSPQSEAEFTRGWRALPTQLTERLSGFEPSFSWTPVPYATGYQVQISDQPFPAPGASTSAPDTTPSPNQRTQASHVDITCFTPRTRLTPFTGVAGDGSKDSLGKCDVQYPATSSTFYWRVRALDSWAGDGAKGPTVPASQSGISYLPPTDPSGQDKNASSPGDLTTDCPTPKASATASASASPSPSTSPSGGPTAAPQSKNCGDPNLPGERGDWTPTASFQYTGTSTVNPLGLVTTDPLSQDPDGLCTVTSAATDSTASKADCADFPTISWNGSSNQAVVYRLYVALDDAFSNIQTIVETSGHEWTPTTGWRDSSPSTSYYYAVQACDVTRCGPVTSTPPSFRKVSPRLTTGATPAVRGPLTLNWHSYADALTTKTTKVAPEDAKYYHVQIATADHPSFDVTVDDAKVDGADLASPSPDRQALPDSADAVSYTPTADLGDGRFVWRVQAVDSFDNKLPWSKSQPFVRDTTPPRAVSAQPGSSVTSKQPVKVTFSEPVTGVSASTLLAATAGSNAPVTVAVASDGRSATLTPTRPWVSGATYSVRVLPDVKDVVGNAAVAAGPSFSVTKTVDDLSGGLSFSGGWTKLSSSNAHGGTFRRSGTAGTAFTTTFYGSSVTLVGCLGPNNGFATVSVGGVAKKLGLYRSYSGCGVPIGTLSGLGRGTHTVRVTVSGTHPAPSHGNNVDVDYLAVG